MQYAAAQLSVLKLYKLNQQPIRIQHCRGKRIKSPRCVAQVMCCRNDTVQDITTFLQFNGNPEMNLEC